MIAWIWDKLIGRFCYHHWVAIGKTDLVSHGGAIPHAQRFTLQCSKCGNIKSKRVGGCAPWQTN